MSESAQPLIQARRHQEGVLDRRGGDARPLGHPPRDPAGRVRRHLRAVGLRQVDAAGDPRAARLAVRRQVLAERPGSGRAADVAAGPGSQPRDRVHLPELQPDRRPDGLRERRAAAHLPRHEVGRAARARQRRARARRHGAPRQAPALAALGRSAAARRRGPRRRRPAVDPAGRRADRQPRLEERRGGDGPAARAAPRRRDDLHGHARSALRGACRSHRFTCSTAGSSKTASRRSPSRRRRAT